MKGNLITGEIVAFNVPVMKKGIRRLVNGCPL